jgi:hypothetical protein
VVDAEDVGVPTGGGGVGVPIGPGVGVLTCGCGGVGVELVGVIPPLALGVPLPPLESLVGVGPSI